MAFLKFSRDKRGYENFYLVQPTTRRGSKARPRVLYWFRTPPHVKVGRKPFDVEVQRSLETRNPGVAFDWETIVNTPIPPVDAEHWRERRRIDREIRRSQSEPVVEEPPKPDGVGDDINDVADIADVADGAGLAVELEVTAPVSEATPVTPQAAGAPAASVVLDPAAAVRGAGRRRRRRRGRRGRGGLPGDASQGAPAASVNGIQEVERDESPEAGPEEPEGNDPTGEV